MLKKLLLLPVTAVLLATSLVACTGGGDGSAYTPASQFVNNLNLRDPYVSYSVAKDPTKAGGGYIVVRESNGDTYAVDINSSYRYTYNTDLDYYLADSFRVWPATSPGYYVDSYGNLYQAQAATSKDLETIGAQVEKLRVANFSEQLVANYGLSEERGLQLAQVLVDYKNLQKTRSLTAADEDAFAKQALGFTISEASSAVASGDASAVNSLINKAAETNDTSPEHIRELMVNLVK